MEYLVGYNLKKFIGKILKILFLVGIGIFMLTILPIAFMMILLSMLVIAGMLGVQKIIDYFTSNGFNIKKRTNFKVNSFTKVDEDVEDVSVEFVSIDTSYDGKIIDVNYKEL